ncbi:MAG: GNAT family N-acetyltransferase, partial [Actinobacteria bacterium]|nr:GNAT family N-acetyltransferase [Actinomycetota bacterium]
MLTSQRLKDGSTLAVSELGPGEGRGDTPETRAIWDFIARPFDPWMAPAEAQWLVRFLAGSTTPQLRDYLYVGRVDGRIVGTAWHATSAATPEIGAYGFVLTDAGWRGRGIAQILTERSSARFWADGGQAIYLGTVNPVARHVYAKAGYGPYNGLAMRAVRPGRAPDAFDREYYAADGPVQVRPATIGDLGGYTALLLAHEPVDWRLRDHTEAIFYAPPALTATGCLRAFYNSLLRHEGNPANQFLVLVTSRHRIVASANLAGPAAGGLRGTATLEFQCYPTYRARLGALLSATLDAARAAGVRLVRAYADGPGRLEALAEAGFAVESVAGARCTL